MSVQIGISDLHYALLTSDEVDATPVYATPVSVAGIMSANINPNTSSETLFADDGPYESATTLGKIEVEIKLADLTLDEQSVFLGHTLASGVLKRKAADSPPWMAIGFKSLKSNGKYRYTWLAKGKFAPSEQSNETRTDQISFQTPSIKGSFVKRVSDDEWERHVDEDHDDYQESYGTSWFNGPTAVGG